MKKEKKEYFLKLSLGKPEKRHFKHLIKYLRDSKLHLRAHA
jgi:hypothetical protein